MKTILITGGSRGIGAATAILAAKQGYNVIVSYNKNLASADKLAQEINCRIIQADISQYTDISRLYDLAGPVDAVVNNAGISIGAANIMDLDPVKLQQLMAVNVMGTMLSCKESAKRKVKTIVNVSSMAATMGGRPGSIPYAASKAAVDSMTIGLARELKNTRVNAVRPGYTLTDMTQAWTNNPEVYAKNVDAIPLGRPATPEDVASTIMWLVSDDSSYLSGTIVDVSGGGYTIAGGH